MVEHNVGRVFTPITWATWLVEVTGVFDAWINGATVCDPTFGGGAFIFALIETALKHGAVLTRDRMDRLYGIEIEPQDKPRLIQQVANRFGIGLREENFLTTDVLLPEVSSEYDCLIGNPPWVNFSILPQRLRCEWAERYLEYGLVKSRKDVLLGASRTDLASLILKKTIDVNLRENGHCAFFIPLSLFFNSGSNDLFRPYPGSSHSYSVRRLWDFGNEPVFEDVATRYGAVEIVKSTPQVWPVETHVRQDDRWTGLFSTASDRKSGFWQRHSTTQNELTLPPLIGIRSDQKPRQGVNTCGANDILIFSGFEGQYKNGIGEVVEIEADLLFPLIDKSLFRPKEENQAARLVLLAHDTKTGKPLQLKAIEAFPKALAYLRKNQARLMSRKGTMLNANIKRGMWWSLLGVGSYSFAPWKVVWEALGRDKFLPIVIEGKWQGNQALHAFCPCETKMEANCLADDLRSPDVEDYLKSSAMGGTMNWAQPGRFAKIFTYL